MNKRIFSLYSMAAIFGDVNKAFHNNFSIDYKAKDSRYKGNSTKDNGSLNNYYQGKRRKKKRMAKRSRQINNRIRKRKKHKR